MEAVPQPTETNEDLEPIEEPVVASANDDFSLDDVERLKEAFAHPTETNTDLELIEEPVAANVGDDVSLNDAEVSGVDLGKVDFLC